MEKQCDHNRIIYAEKKSGPISQQLERKTQDSQARDEKKRNEGFSGSQDQDNEGSFQKCVGHLWRGDEKKRRMSFQVAFSESIQDVTSRKGEHDKKDQVRSQTAIFIKSV